MTPSSVTTSRHHQTGSTRRRPHPRSRSPQLPSLVFLAIIIVINGNANTMLSRCCVVADTKHANTMSRLFGRCRRAFVAHTVQNDGWFDRPRAQHQLQGGDNGVMTTLDKNGTSSTAALRSSMGITNASINTNDATNIERRYNSSSASANENDVHRPFRVNIAVGANLGQRFENIASAIRMLCDNETRLVQTSYLHETAPMYVEDQPRFLNGAIEVETLLEPEALLRRLKKIEKDLGRDANGIRNGPRPVDLDILTYDRTIPNSKDDDPDAGKTHVREAITMDTEGLTIPHPRICERDFVLAPLCELAGAGATNDHPTHNVSFSALYQQLLTDKTTANGSDGNEDDAESAMVRVVPLPRNRMLAFNQTIIMGILNLTPDSFSDGGKWTSSTQVAVERAVQMEEEGAMIIDIGGESTRPGAKEVAVEEQIRRTVPIIRGIREVSDVPISIDTRHAGVARAAIEAGADIVNDVSGGTFDEHMLSTVADLRVPIILMHMRGTPETMNSLTDYDDVVNEVGMALLKQSQLAEAAGIPRWSQILDPGIGFAKDFDSNLLLLKQLDRFRSITRDAPLLLGTSRKRFIGTICQLDDAEERDVASIASCVAALSIAGQPTCSVLRVHNVKDTRHATLVMDAILRTK